MPTYEAAPKKVTDQIAKVMKKHQPELQAAKVDITVLMAHGSTDKDGNATGVAITLHGRQCLGMISITSLKMRAAGLGDAIMILDGDRWKDLSAASRAATIDHELEHLRPRWESHPNPDEESDGIPKRDDLGRPRLKMQAHDWELAGFASVLDRHGKAAIESMQLEKLTTDHPQALLPYYPGEGDTPDAETTPSEDGARAAGLGLVGGPASATA